MYVYILKIMLVLLNTFYNKSEVNEVRNHMNWHN